MSAKYFKNFPVVQYGQHQLRNILLKARLAKSIVDAYDSYYPYTIPDTDRITHTAFDYYGSIEYVWLVMASNNMTDPYYDWPMSTDDFERYLIKKYGSLEYAYNVSNARFYRNVNYTYLMTATTFNNLPAEDRIGWAPYSLYDQEFENNEAKREIRLVDKALTSNIQYELEEKLGRVAVQNEAIVLV